MRKIVVKNLNACPCQVVKDVHVYIFLYEIFNQIFLFTETWVLFIFMPFQSVCLLFTGFVRSCVRIMQT